MESGRPLRLLSVGRLVRSKNLFFLLEKLAGIQNKNWTLDIVGSGDELTKLREYSASAGIEAKVKFHGHMDDVTPFYRAADLFVFPSWLENSPVVLLEAMSYSLPTLSFYSDNKKYLGANHEIVAHQHTGFLAKDDENFREILTDIIGKKTSLSAIGAEAYKYVQRNHGWDLHIERIEQLIEEVGK
jgi:glycosyltransferase involved in cell wall biosynthesis